MQCVVTGQTQSLLGNRWVGKQARHCIILLSLPVTWAYNIQSFKNLFFIGYYFCSIYPFHSSHETFHLEM